MRRTPFDADEALKARREFLADARRGDLKDAADPTVMDAAWRR
ncbi:hypothetical protein [Ornithinimicrobium faecis]|nr:MULTISPECIES: hypothetical protein [unclassified Ornithinimicrobium]